MAKASIVRALHEDPEFSELFTFYLMERTIRVQEDLVDQLLNSTEKRLARLLLILANYGKEDRPDFRSQTTTSRRHQTRPATEAAYS
jgi:hypothetical protein